MDRNIIGRTNLKRKFLFLILKLAKRLGLFAVSRFLTAKDLRILCYHGCALQDETILNPGLFPTAEIFKKRMQFLYDKGYPVISLEEALRLLDKGEMPDNATVITIDDGWYGSYKHQFPILQKYSFPATIYISTYYLEKQTQVFGVALRYVLQKCGKAKINISNLGSKIESAVGKRGEVDLQQASELIINYSESLDSASDRQVLLREVCESVGVDWRNCEEARMFCFMTAEEAQEMASNGIDIQLHTHRHRFPIDMSFDLARAEIELNRRGLDGIARSELKHFCYPSGVYSDRTISYLRKLGVVTATTTQHGFNRKGTPKMELKRYLDSEALSDLEFEAELSGFFEIIRKTGYSI